MVILPNMGTLGCPVASLDGKNQKQEHNIWLQTFIVPKSVKFLIQ